MDTLEKLVKRISQLERKLERLESIESSWNFIPLSTPLTSTSFDGDAFSTTAKTKIDLSTAFSAPAGIKAVYIELEIEDSDSTNSRAFFGVSPNDTAGSYAVVDVIEGQPNDTYVHITGICPCDSGGDIYYQCQASGVGTLDVKMNIWGYWI